MIANYRYLQASLFSFCIHAAIFMYIYGTFDANTSKTLLISKPLQVELKFELPSEDLNKQIPILGVCRGLQVLNIFFGGKLEIDIALAVGIDHVACEHPVHLEFSIFQKLVKSDQIIVNSFHNQGVLLEGLAKDLKCFAATKDGVVEGIFHPNLPILAIQWHPERKNSSMEFDKQLLQRFFQEGAFWDPIFPKKN